jgi:hypothetical protein
MHKLMQIGLTAANSNCIKPGTKLCNQHLIN